MKFRLILDPPRRGTLNMAIDEALMNARASDAACLPDRQAPPVLRIYSWNAPCQTVGYFQNASEIAQRARSRVIRRLTGGGRVSHGKDLTFSLAARLPNPLFPADVKASYLKVNEALIAGLGRLFDGLDFASCKDVPSGRGGERVCFEQPSCYDVLLKKRKVVGASQRRRGRALLHQSSIFLDGSREDLAACVVDGFRKKWGAEFLEEPLSPEEIAEAERIETERYASAEWAFPPLGPERRASFFA